MMQPITTRTVSVNIAKVVTVMCLLTLPFLYSVHTRQVVYLALHVSYIAWFLLKQAIFREPLYRERDSAPQVVMVVALVGVFYALPGWLAFTNTEPVNELVLAASVALFFFGSMLNSGADIQKSAALRARPSLVTDSFWSLSRNINYFGDLMRYSAFAVLSGSLWSWSVVLVVLGISLNRMRMKEASLSRYPDYTAYRRCVPILVPMPFYRRFRPARLTAPASALREGN